MKLLITSIKYTVKLTNKQWSQLNCLDFIDDINIPLNEIGARSIDYNGHFGKLFFFTCNNKKIANKILAKLKLILSSKKANSKIETGDCYR